MLNSIILSGWAEKDAELTHTQSGSTIAAFTMRTDESYMSKDGGRVEQYETHRVLCFGELANYCASHLVQGALVSVSGSLATREWTDKSGLKRYVTEVKAHQVEVFGAGSGPQATTQAHGQRQATPQAPYQQQRQAAPQSPPAAGSMAVDEVPF